MQVYNSKPIFYGCGPLVDDYCALIHQRQQEQPVHVLKCASQHVFRAPNGVCAACGSGFRADVRNDLALLYNVHVPRASPRQIEKVVFVPLRRTMGISSEPSVLQTNTLPTDDDDWQVLFDKFTERCDAFGVELEIDESSGHLILTL